MDSVKIRKNTINDTKEINHLYHTLHPELQGSSVDIDHFNAGHKIFVADNEGQIAGFVWLTFIEYGVAQIGYVEELSVKENYRNKGIGTQLITKALKYFKSRNIDVIFVSVSLEDKDVQEFYKKVGFVPCKGSWLYFKG